MMAQKHLHELLLEDQEPFLLKNYIADRRCQLKRPSLKSHLQVKKRKPSISQTSHFPQNFCKNACFFSLNNSPDPRKSPLFDFQSPAKSPCKSPNAIFLHIPARTASLLLEAALRIQKQSSSSSSPKTKTQNKNNGFGLFGSLLRRLTHRNKTRKCEISGDGIKVSVKDILKWDSSVGCRNLSGESDCKQVKEITAGGVNEKIASELSSCEIVLSCPCNGRPSSAVWSETNEDKSLDLDLETSSSGQSEGFLVGNFEFNKLMDDTTDFASFDAHFCESPFHFVLRRSPSPGHRTPDFSSPVTSPCRHRIECKENDDVESSKKFQSQENEEEEEEDKEQCSPVSVLDPPFEDDDDAHEDRSEDDGFDTDCSYAIVQRAKHQLLQKLRRFEKLAELDPVELEERMLEQEQDDDDNNNMADDLENEDGYKDDELVSLEKEKSIDNIIIELCRSSFHRDMKRLVSDLFDEEQREQNCFADRDATVKRVCKRLESWKEVESNTIDMMVEQDFKKELDGWKRSEEQVEETALEIELGIFGFLMEELSEELIDSSGDLIMGTTLKL